MILSLIVGLLAGLAIFYWLTKRLRSVSRNMEKFSDSDFSHWPAQGHGEAVKDEISQIEYTFSQMAERIQIQLMALKDKDNQRRQLVAQISHDLRTPLASMLGYVESLQLKQDTLSNAEHSKFLDIVYTQGQRLSYMIDSLFQLSSLEAREIEPTLEPFMPLEILYDIKQKHTIRAQKAELSIEILPDQSAQFVRGDISLFERVLDNLIDNAMVHATSRSVIELKVEHDKEFVSVAVMNRGEAIAKENMEALFDPFFRVETQSANKRHAGLGLAISKRIMESLNGTIAVSNTADGVSFSIAMPRVK